MGERGYRRGDGGGGTGGAMGERGHRRGDGGGGTGGAMGERGHRRGDGGGGTGEAMGVKGIEEHGQLWQTHLHISSRTWSGRYSRSQRRDAT